MYYYVMKKLACCSFNLSSPGTILSVTNTFFSVFPTLFVSLSAGCQVCGGEEEAAAGLPSHGDEQTDPDAARVHSPPLQRDPAVSAAFLSVSGHTRARSIHVLSLLCEHV